MTTTRADADTVLADAHGDPAYHRTLAAAKAAARAVRAAGRHPYLIPLTASWLVGVADDAGAARVLGAAAEGRRLAAKRKARERVAAWEAEDAAKAG